MLNQHTGVPIVQTSPIVTNTLGLVLPVRPNDRLYRQLQLEFIREEFQAFITRLMFVGQRNSRLVSPLVTEDFPQIMLGVVHQAILANVWREFYERDVGSFFQAQAWTTFASRVEVAYSLYSDIAKSIITQLSGYEYDQYECERDFGYIIADYITEIYFKSSDIYNEIFTELFFVFDQYARHLKTASTSVVGVLGIIVNTKTMAPVILYSVREHYHPQPESNESLYRQGPLSMVSG